MTILVTRTPGAPWRSSWLRRPYASCPKASVAGVQGPYVTPNGFSGKRKVVKKAMVRLRPRSQNITSTSTLAFLAPLNGSFSAIPCYSDPGSPNAASTASLRKAKRLQHGSGNRGCAETTCQRLSGLSLSKDPSFLKATARDSGLGFRV